MKIGVALSGGKDSALAAALLAREGHQVTGYHLLLPPARYAAIPPEEQSAAVREVGQRLGVVIRVIDGREAFQREIMGAFVAAYRSGETPNPCVRCNRLFKFGLLFDAARDDGCQRLATGHYARLEAGARPRLKKPLPPLRDETYFLFDILPERLSRLLFPLGELSPDVIRQLFRELLPGFVPLPVSREACFLSRSGLRRFLADNIPKPGRPGEIVNRAGKVLGVHPGCHFYTVGQRKGLNSASGKKGPLYVLRVIPETNRVVVGEKPDLLARRFSAVRPNWLSIPPPEDSFTAQTKIRYTHPAAKALITPREDGGLEVEFADSQEAPTPGQAAVFYQNDILLGGGWIKKFRGHI
jgi:tRNA-uridine 2-sulfurtransferase